MPKPLQVHAGERVDVDDFTRGTATFTQDVASQTATTVMLDNQARYLRGFRVELPAQATYPGRIVVHGGDAYDPSGDKLLNEDQATVSRTITLEGASTDFYVEIEYFEGDSDIDARAFWDPTVDQGPDTSGDELPDGQEFSDNVATRKSPDWRVVTPISTTAFARDADPTSTKLPLVQLRTNASNQIVTASTNTKLATEYPATTILWVDSTKTILRVRDAQLFLANNDVTVGEGAATSETATISTVEVAKGHITLSGALTNSHDPGEVLRAKSGGSAAPLDIIEESLIGRYRRDAVGATQPDHEVDVKDKFFQGDPIHGEVLSQGHSASATQQNRSDVNLQAMKDRIDFMAAQLQEMKWGIMNPHTSMTDSSRAAPGVDGVIFPTTPHYYHRTGGIAPSRMVTVTVGDGRNSFGDFNGEDEVALQAAHDALPTEGGRIFIKKGTYDVGSGSAGLVISNAGTVIIESDGDAVLQSNGGFYVLTIDAAATSRVILKNLIIERGASETGLEYKTTNVSAIQMYNCRFENVRVNIDKTMPWSNPVTAADRDNKSVVKDCIFYADHANMSSYPLINVTVNGILAGKWENCNFYHHTASSLTGHSIDASAGAVSHASFLQCEFATATVSANTDNVNVGGAVATYGGILFDDCEFYTVNTNYHIKALGTTPGKGLTVRNCRQSDYYSGILHATGWEAVTVDGFQHVEATPDSFPGLGIDLVDCTQVKIVNCSLRINGVADAAQAPIIIRAYSTGSSGIIIANNSIEAQLTVSYDSGVGIILDTQVSKTIEGVIIKGNEVRNCEIGVCLRSIDATAGTIKDLVISDNIIVDTGVSGTVANNMKLGIFADTNITKTRWNITGNQITNVNPANTNSVLGITSRRGIDIQGTNNTDFVVSKNSITRVGSSGNEVATTAGIRFVGITEAVVTSNLVRTVVGTDAAGIVVGTGTNTISNVSVGDNYVESVIATGASQAAYGVAWSIATELSVSGNSVSLLATSGTGSGALIAATSPSSGTTRSISICSNTGYQTAADIDAIYLGVFTLDLISITGNSIVTNDRSIVFETDIGGSIEGVTINGNNMLAANSNLVMNLGKPVVASSITRISVAGNSFVVTGADSNNLEMDTCQRFSIGNNLLENTGTPTSAGRNIYCNDCEFFTIIGNTCETVDDTQAINVEIDSSTNWTCIGNLLDQAGGAFGTSLKTNLSGVDQVNDKGICIANMYDGANNAEADVYGATLSAGASQGQQY
jgi:hypothetical protein